MVIFLYLHKIIDLLMELCHKIPNLSYLQKAHSKKEQL